MGSPRSRPGACRNPEDAAPADFIIRFGPHSLGPVDDLYIDNVFFSDKVASGPDDIVSIGFDESAMSLLTIEPLEGQDQYLNAAAVSDAITASSPTGDQALRVTKADGVPTDSGIVTTVAGGGQISLLDENHSQVTMDVRPVGGEVIRLRLEEAGRPNPNLLWRRALRPERGRQKPSDRFRAAGGWTSDPTADYNQLTWSTPGTATPATTRPTTSTTSSSETGHALSPRPDDYSRHYCGGCANTSLTRCSRTRPDLVPGNTYVFDWGDAAGHPLLLSTTIDGHFWTDADGFQGVELSSAVYDYTVDRSAKTTTIVVDNFTPPPTTTANIIWGWVGPQGIASPLTLWPAEGRI